MEAENLLANLRMIIKPPERNDNSKMKFEASLQILDDLDGREFEGNQLTSHEFTAHLFLLLYYLQELYSNTELALSSFDLFCGYE